MAEHGVAEGAQVVGDDERASLHQGVGPAHLLQGDRASRAGTELDVLGERRVDHLAEASRRLGDGDGVALDRLVDVDPRRQLDEEPDVLQIDDWLQIRCPRAEHTAIDALEHLELLVGGGVVDHVLEQEAVELRLGEDVRALLLDRVLRREDHERRRQRVHHTADRRLALLHRFQHRALRLGARPVDLVEEHEVGVHRTEAGVERRRVRVVHLRAEDVARQQVRCALDAHERSVDGAGQCRRRRRLGQAGDALEEDVSLGEERHDECRAQPSLADDLGLVRLAETVEQLSPTFQVGVGDRPGQRFRGRDRLPVGHHRRRWWIGLHRQAQPPFAEHYCGAARLPPCAWRGHRASTFQPRNDRPATAATRGWRDRITAGRRVGGRAEVASSWRRLPGQRRRQGVVPTRRLRAPRGGLVGGRAGRDRSGLRPVPARRDRRRRQGPQRHDDRRARQRSIPVRDRQRDGAAPLLPRVAGQPLRAPGGEHRPAAVRRGHGHRLRSAPRQAARSRRRRVRLASGSGVLDRDG